MKKRIRVRVIKCSVQGYLLFIPLLDPFWKKCPCWWGKE